ncbi:acetylglutamate kinase [Pillotina sp. SPG140]|jgi:acetylglutamate kinase
MKESRAETLVQALPYIQQYRGKTVVVKYGGSAMISDQLKSAVIQDIILMACVGIRTVLVHGGGPEIDSVLKKMDKKSHFVQGLRYTDEETMEVVLMVLCGTVNKKIVHLIQNQGGKALGLCGIDGGLLKARRLRPNGEDIGFVGAIETVNTAVLDSLLDSGLIPVISSVALESGAEHVLNVNADSASAMIATALHAEKLMLITDVPGILRDVHDPSSLISHIAHAEIDDLMHTGVVSKGMIPKVQCCTLALDGGVKKAHILDGRLPHALLIELFTDEGIGTMIF